MATTAPAQPFPTTPFLGLGLGQDARANTNWATIDNAVCWSGQGTIPCGNGVSPFTATGTQVIAADNTGATNVTNNVQAAINSGVAIVKFPPGTFRVCGLNPTAANGQQWVGSGKGQTILQTPPNCPNLIVLANLSGPSPSWDVSGFTFKSNTGGQTLINMDGGTVFRAHLHDNAFDVGAGFALGGSGATAISWSGGAEVTIERNEFYSSLPGYGNAITLLRAARQTRILNNAWTWLFSGLQINTTQGTEDVDVGDNTGDLGWYAEPVKFTNSGGTVTYTSSTLTDTAANFTNLCGDTGTSPCAAGTGQFVRALTVNTTGTANVTFFAPGIIGDTGVNFATNATARGMLVRSAPVCRGNGGLGVNARQSCGGAAGSALWGDGCPCTSNADCGANICQARFATVMGFIDASHVAIDEWTSDVDRLPTGQPKDGTPYTIYSALFGQVSSFTATTITLATGTSTWFDWFGNATTPANGTLYEVMTKHPNYQILVASFSPVIQKGRIHDNSFTRGHSDQIGMNNGINWIITGNQTSDGQDGGITVSGPQAIVANNILDHQGSVGIFVGGSDITVDNNTIQNPTWTNNANTVSLGCIQSNAGNRSLIRGTKCLVTLAMALNRYGIASTGTTDSTQLVNSTFQGTFTVGAYRLNGATVTNEHIIDYHGETISTTGGPTFSIEGGLATEAAIVANAAQNGSYVGCADCTVANPCAAAGTGAVAKRQGAAWVCN